MRKTITFNAFIASCFIIEQKWKKKKRKSDLSRCRSTRV